MENRLFLSPLFYLLFLLLSIPNAFSATQHPIQYSSLSTVPQAAWNKLAGKKIYFGHQSVGANIIAGLKDILQRHPDIKLKIIYGSQTPPYTFSEPGLLHNRIGRNMDPYSKIDDFKNTLENKFINKPDIAFFKFCFVDFSPLTDVNKVFVHYKETIHKLKNEYPNTVFVHITAPLTCYAPGPSGWIKRGKDIIKKLIGKINIYDFSNANIYNKKLVQEYQGKEPLFNLALYESKKPDGTRVTYKKNDQTYYKLVQSYTSDGGHLNKKGKKIIAEQLLLYLANLTEGL